jgi:hypothetical protein
MSALPDTPQHNQNQLISSHTQTSTSTKEASTQTDYHRLMKFNRTVSNTINHKRTQLNCDQEKVRKDIDRDETTIRNIDRSIIANSNIRKELENRKELQIKILETLNKLNKNLRQTYYISKHTTNRYHKTEERKKIEIELRHRRQVLDLYLGHIRKVHCLHHKFTESCSLCFNYTSSYNVDIVVLAKEEKPQ